MTPTTAPGVAARARLPTWRIAVECSRCGLLLPRGGGGTSIGSSQTGGRYALHEDLGRLSHRHALAPARSLHRERLGAHAGPQWTPQKGAPFGLVGGIGSTGTKYVPGQNHRVDVMASTGLYDDGKKGIRRPGDPHLRVKDMDR